MCGESSGGKERVKRGDEKPVPVRGHRARRDCGAGLCSDSKIENTDDVLTGEERRDRTVVAAGCLTGVALGTYGG